VRSALASVPVKRFRSYAGIETCGPIDASKTHCMGASIPKLIPRPCASSARIFHRPRPCRAKSESPMVLRSCLYFRRHSEPICNYWNTTNANVVKLPCFAQLPAQVAIVTLGIATVTIVGTFAGLLPLCFAGAFAAARCRFDKILESGLDIVDSIAGDRQSASSRFDQSRPSAALLPSS
jgi:hypothetical protein